MWSTRWLFASLPGTVAFLVLGFALGFAAGGTGAALSTALILTAVLWLAWFSLAFLPLGRTRDFWRAQPEPLLERSWFRAFDEAGLAPPPSPLFLVFSDPAPLLLAWCSGSGEQVLLISRAWLAATPESKQREALRRAAVRLSETGIRWRTAEAWFVALLLRRLPRGVRDGLWASSGNTRSGVLAWVVALPWVAWLLWVQRILGPRDAALTPASGTNPLPLDPARCAAATLMSVEALPRSKSILSFSPAN